MTMPSGSDPSGYDSSADGSVVGQGLSSLLGRSQTAVTESKKAVVQSNDIISTVIGSLFDGLRQGISLPLAILEKIAHSVLETTEEFLHIDDVIAALKGVPDAIGKAVGMIQVFIDTVVNAITGGTGIFNTLVDLAQALHLIPPDNVTGAGGAATIFDSIFAIIDAFLGGAVGKPGSTGGSLADLTQVAGEVASGSALGSYAWQLVNMLNNTPVARGMLATGRANYDLTSANTFVPTTKAASLSASFGLMQSMAIGVISWYGYGSSNITGFYINIRKVNLTNGVRDLVHQSGNIVGLLQAGTTAADADWMFYELPDALAGEAIANYYVEWVVVGTGTHFLRGMSFTDNIKDHPIAATPSYGTAVTYTNAAVPDASLPKATAGTNVPWVEFAVSLGAVLDHREPLVYTFSYDGESIPIPNWANLVDAIPLSQGGSGHQGLTVGFGGDPGEPGKFAPVTWQRDIDFIGDATLVTFAAPADGSSGISIPGHSTTAVKGANGATARFGLNPIGRGPGVFPYNGQEYVGGGDQKVPGAAGTNPGGGGNGGQGLILPAGGKGGKAAGWVCFRQVVVVDESAGDFTPPTAPTSLHVDNRTLSSITITASGAVDA